MVNNDIVGREVINMIKLYIYSLKCMTFIKLNTAAAFIYFLWGAFSPSFGEPGGGVRGAPPPAYFFGERVISSREVSQ